MPRRTEVSRTGVINPIEDKSSCMRPSKLDVLHPQLQSFYEVWESVRRDRPMPRIKDLPPRLLKPWYANILLVAVLGPQQFRYDYYGRAFIEAFGADLTGRTIDRIEADKADIIRLDYQACVRTGKPISRIHTGEFSGGSETWHRLILPLTGNDDEDTETVRQILVSAYPIRRE